MSDEACFRNSMRELPGRYELRGDGQFETENGTILSKATAHRWIQESRCQLGVCGHGPEVPILGHHDLERLHDGTVRCRACRKRFTRDDPSQHRGVCEAGKPLPPPSSGLRRFMLFEGPTGEEALFGVLWTDGRASVCVETEPPVTYPDLEAVKAAHPKATVWIEDPANDSPGAKASAEGNDRT